MSEPKPIAQIKPVLVPDTKPGLPMTELAREKRTCKKHGKYDAVQVKIFGHVQWWGCEKCEKESRDAENAAEQQSKLEERVKHAGIPTRFRQKDFAGYTAEHVGQQKALMMCRTYAERFTEHLASGRCLSMVGRPGTGKTHLAFAIIRTVLAAGFTARYITVYEAIEAIRETWRHDCTETESQVLRKLTSPDLLVLDEVGVQYGKESEQIELFKILNKRYNELRPSIVISNVSVDDLKKYLGERVFDRLRENDGKVIIFDWESERGK